MSINLDSVKKTIRDLLNLAENDAAAAQEAANAMHFARRLMLRHNLAEADCAEIPEKSKNSHEVAADTEYAETTSYTQGAKRAEWEIALRRAVADLVGTVKFYSYHEQYTRRTLHGTIDFDEKGRVRKAKKTVFYGPKADTVAARDLVEEWTLTIMAMARLRFGGCFRGAGRSYCEGFVDALHDQVQKAQQYELDAPEEAAAALGDGCTALALVQSREIMQAKQEYADEWLSNVRGLKLSHRSSRSNAEHHGGAFNSGRSDGSRANFSRTQTKAIGR